MKNVKTPQTLLIAITHLQRHDGTHWNNSAAKCLRQFTAL